MKVTPRHGGKITKKNMGIFTKYEAKQPWKTGTLSMIGGRNIIRKNTRSIPWEKNNRNRNKNKPKAGGITTKKNTRIIPRQEPKPPTKTSKIAHGMQKHQRRYQNYVKETRRQNKEITKLCAKNIKIIPRIYKIISNNYYKTGDKIINRNIQIISKQEKNHNRK